MTDKEIAQEILNKACKLYCTWYDIGKPEMRAEDMAYQLVSSCRHALQHLKDEECTVCQ